MSCTYTSPTISPRQQDARQQRRLGFVALLPLLGLFFEATWFQAEAASPTASFLDKKITASDGVELRKSVISSPPRPPLGTALQRMALSDALVPAKESGINTLTAPALDWFFGCSATSAAMIAGYYDRNGFPNLYTGPANGGVMPLDNSSWPTWRDASGDTFSQCPLTASRNGLDGRTTRGSIDDYWAQYGHTGSDPYLTQGVNQHAWGSAIGDYMKTSQSNYENTDGSTTFYNYLNLANQLTCAAMEGYGISSIDGTYGRKLFYEAKGYTVTTCFNQLTDNKIIGGFSFAQYMAEIDAGRPVMLNLEGHTIVGVGYNSSTSTVYLHDTWDNSVHTMTWGSSYANMPLYSVSIVNLQPQAAETPGTETVPAAGNSRPWLYLLLKN